jgi:hypothetical protein
MGRAIPIGCLQREHHLPGPVEWKVFIGNDGSDDSAQCRILGALANPWLWLSSFLR